MILTGVAFIGIPVVLLFVDDAEIGGGGWLLSLILGAFLLVQGARQLRPTTEVERAEAEATNRKREAIGTAPARPPWPR